MIGINKEEVTNMKINILVGITISLLLVLPVAASDYTLEIFGNANEDDTINMQDVTYTELIILEYRDRTELSDAKYDDKINMQDVTQIELVILGRELELTVLDSDDRVVTINKPVERIIPLVSSIFIETLRTLDVADKIVAIDGSAVKAPKIYLGELCELPSLGGGGYGGAPDIEVLLSLEPDFVLISAMSYYDGIVDTIESADPGIAILRLECVNVMVQGDIDSEIEDITKLGYILDRREAAEEFSDWYYGVIGSIKDQTETLPEDEKPRVLYGDLKQGGAPEWYTYNKHSPRHETLEIAGGRNIASDVDFGVGFGGGACGYVDFEWLIEQNPEIIIRYYSARASGGGAWRSYDIDDTTEIIAQRDEVLNRPEFANVDAVKNEEVQMLSVDVIYYGTTCLSVAYFAKLFHPELFEDLDPKVIHQEFLTRFQRIDYDLDKHGVFVYPPLEES